MRTGLFWHTHAYCRLPAAVCLGGVLHADTYVTYVYDDVTYMYDDVTRPRILQTTCCSVPWRCASCRYICDICVWWCDLYVWWCDTPTHTADYLLQCALEVCFMQIHEEGYHKAVQKVADLCFGNLLYQQKVCRMCSLTVESVLWL